MEEKEKSQLAKNLADALFVCKLRDDLAELVDDARVQDMNVTDNDIRKKIHACYLKSVVLLACAIVDSKEIKNVVGGHD